MYLTKNGRGKYVVQSLLNMKSYRRPSTFWQRLSKGVESYHREGGLTVDEAFAGLEG